MQHERIEWDNAHRQDAQARDGRHIDWEALKKHNEGNQEKRTELHYLQKEENERVKELLQKRSTAENTLKHRIADRDIPLTENQAVIIRSMPTISWISRKGQTTSNTTNI